MAKSMSRRGFVVASGGALDTLLAATAVSLVAYVTANMLKIEPFYERLLSNLLEGCPAPEGSQDLEVEGRKVRDRMEWDFTVGVAKVYALRWKYHNAMKSRVLHVRITDNKGTVYKDDDITFLQTQEKKTKRKMTSITTGSQINAGTYHVVLTGDGISDMLFDPLTVE